MSVGARARCRERQRTSTSFARRARKDSLADDADIHRCDCVGLVFERFLRIACDDVMSLRRARAIDASVDHTPFAA